MEITDKQYDLFLKLLKAAKHDNPEKFPDHYFISGQGGKVESHLPEYLYICPAFGADWSVRYKKDE